MVEQTTRARVPCLAFLKLLSPRAARRNADELNAMHDMRRLEGSMASWAIGPCGARPIAILIYTVTIVIEEVNIKYIQ